MRRVRKLEDQGYIHGYSANVDERRLVGSIIVFVSITMVRQTGDILDIFEKKISTLPEVMSGFLMTGGSDYLLRVVVRDMDHYQTLLSVITHIEGVAHIHSSFALKGFINRPAPVLRP